MILMDKIFFDLKRFIFLIKYLFFCRWKFALPKKNKFILFDGIYNPFLKYLKKNDFTYLYRRGEEINFSILLKCLIKFKFSSLDYCAEFIKHVSPKLILTAFDYHTNFYKLSKKTGIKTLMLQKGKRSRNDGIISDKIHFPANSRKFFFVDYVLIYNDFVKNFYSKRIKGNFYTIGSFENNIKEIDFSNQKKEIIFVSNYSCTNNKKSENEEILAYHLNNLAKKEKIKFNILPRYRNDKKNLIKEKNFYKTVFKNKINFILDKNISSYKIILKYKYLFATYSTLATEFLAKGGKAGLINFKSRNNLAYHYRFGGFEGLGKKGTFWCSFYKCNTSEIKRVFNYVLKTNKLKWFKQNNKNILKVVNYNKNNSIFINILKENNITTKNA